MVFLNCKYDHVTLLRNPPVASQYPHNEVQMCYHGPQVSLPHPQSGHFPILLHGPLHMLFCDLEWGRAIPALVTPNPP